jgi:hypothetical protein
MRDRGGYLRQDPGVLGCRVGLRNTGDEGLSLLQRRRVTVRRNTESREDPSTRSSLVEHVWSFVEPEPVPPLSARPAAGQARLENDHASTLPAPRPPRRLAQPALPLRLRPAGRFYLRAYLIDPAPRGFVTRARWTAVSYRNAETARSAN